MSIQKINSVSFGKKEYKKNYRNTKIMATLGTVSATSLLAMPKIMKYLYKDSALDGFEKLMPKKVTYFSAASSLIFSLGLGLGLDYIANKKEADSMNKNKI